MAGKQCACCGRFFPPEPRAGGHQKVCALGSCRREWQRRKYRGWIKGHPAHAASRRGKIRAWAAASTYWRRYRVRNAKYRERERRRMAAKRRTAAHVAKQDATDAFAIEKLLAARSCDEKTVAKQTAVAGISVEKQRMDTPIRLETVAKQTAVARRLDLVVEYLILRDGVANKLPSTWTGPARDNVSA